MAPILTNHAEHLFAELEKERESLKRRGDARAAHCLSEIQPILDRYGAFMGMTPHIDVNQRDGRVMVPAVKIIVVPHDRDSRFGAITGVATFLKAPSGST